MGHPKVHNRTPFEFAPLFLSDTEGQPLFVGLLKASFRIEPDGQLQIAEPQAPVCIGGEFWGPPESSSYKLEPEGIPSKLATDVVLLGHAYPERAGDLEVLAGMCVGSVRKLARVVGDRHWVRVAGVTTLTSPQPFDRMPLLWERAFGGWDRSSEDPREHRCEPRNPIGTGFRVRWNDAESSVALPNIEHPDQPVRHFDDRPEPVGFGFVAANWQPRAALAGTYDEAWVKSRMPRFPQDFNPQFWNGAPRDQIVPGYLQGHEPVVLLNVSPRGRVAFNLPGAGAPRMDVELRGKGAQALMPVLDTVIINSDTHEVSLVWRASIPVADVPTDVVSVQIEWPEVLARYAAPAAPLAALVTSDA
jgi:hypothetical protein